ncbi:MAG: hypothetical protein EBZ48_14000, partial [Proteobacteria bacterium]|nr:hypothetical protein [Pseudomonadota bacterium]
SQTFSTTYQVEVLHRQDGLFEASAFDRNGRRSKRCYCRLSNGLRTVVAALTGDVLEKIAPEELF